MSQDNIVSAKNRSALLIFFSFIYLFAFFISSVFSAKGDGFTEAITRSGWEIMMASAAFLIFLGLLHFWTQSHKGSSGNLINAALAAVFVLGIVVCSLCYLSWARATLPDYVNLKTTAGIHPGMTRQQVEKI